MNGSTLPLSRGVLGLILTWSTPASSRCQPFLDIRGLEAAYRLGYLCPGTRSAFCPKRARKQVPDLAFVPQWQRSKPRHRQVCALSLVEGGA